MELIPPKKELMMRTCISDPLNLYYAPFPFVRNLFWERIKFTLCMLRKKKYERILEIGVGSGITLPTITKISDKVYAIDIHKFLSKLKPLLRYYKIEKKVFLKRCSVEKLPFKARYFDVIIGISVLEHLENPEKGIKEVARVLKKDGEAVFGFPTKSVLNSILFPILALFKEHEFGEHKQHAEEIIKMLKKYFIIEKIKFLPSFLPKKLALYSIAKLRKK